MYGLLGENGAGKSTTIEILEGHRHATTGEVSVLGVDPRRADGGFYDRIGIVLLANRGDYPHEIARYKILPALARLVAHA